MVHQPSKVSRSVPIICCAFCIAGPGFADLTLSLKNKSKSLDFGKRGGMW